MRGRLQSSVRAITGREGTPIVSKRSPGERDRSRRATMILRSLLPAVTRSHAERRRLPASARHLFRIINDVDRYAEFLPLCRASRILWRHGDCYRATLTVGLPPLLEETYTSHVEVDAVKLVVAARSVESQRFEALASRWQLQDRGPDECLVDFSVSLTVRDPLIVATLDRILEQVARRQVEAFAQRCREIPETKQ